MANKVQILDKIKRNLDVLGVTATRGATSIVVENGSNDLTITCEDADIQKPMGGVDGTSSPFIGIGVANPCTIKVKSAISTADTVADVLDSDVAAKVLHLVAGHANDILLENSDASFALRMRGQVDLLGLGM